MIDVFTMENHDADTGMTLWGYRGEGCHFVSQGVKCKKSILLTSFFFFFFLILLTSWSGISGIQNCGKISFCFLTHQSVVLIYHICGIDIPYQYTFYVYCVHLCMMTLAIIVGIYTVPKMRDSLRNSAQKKKWRLQQYNFHKSQKERKF